MRRRRGFLGREVDEAITTARVALAASGHELLDDVILDRSGEAEVVDVRLAGSAPRVAGDHVVELTCAECGLALQVVVANGGPADWRHAAPPCARWLSACRPSTPEDHEYREAVRVATVAALRN